MLSELNAQFLEHQDIEAILSFSLDIKDFLKEAGDQKEGLIFEIGNIVTNLVEGKNHV